MDPIVFASLHGQPGKKQKFQLSYPIFESAFASYETSGTRTSKFLFQVHVLFEQNSECICYVTVALWVESTHV